MTDKTLSFDGMHSLQDEKGTRKTAQSTAEPDQASDHSYRFRRDPAALSARAEAAVAEVVAQTAQN